MKNNLTEQRNLTLDFTTKNEPNAGILIYALQHLGYDNMTAICDIIDNSIDVDSSIIKIDISKSTSGNMRIAIIDNGWGMTKEKLDEALRLGSDTAHTSLDDLGKFGMGLSTAGLALANITTVLTKTADDPSIYKSVTDVHEIKEQNAFVKFLGEATPEEIEYFNKEVNNNSGTIVIFEDCVGVKYKNKGDNCTPFVNALTKHISRTFRKFMNSTKFIINGTDITPADVLMLNNTKVYTAMQNDDPSLPDEKIEVELQPAAIKFDEDVEIKWYDEKNMQHTDSIHVRLVQLPNCSADIAKQLSINPGNQGFSILRNNREILYGYCPSGWPTISTRHPSANRVRGEISFSSELDDAFGVNFTKSGIDWQDSINDELKRLLVPIVSQIIKDCDLAKIADKNEKINHDGAAAIINKKTKTLITPSAAKEKRNKSTAPEKQEPTASKDTKTRTPVKTQLEKANAEFRTMHMTASGPIYDARIDGKKITVDWNVDHPFYSRFIIENENNKTLIDSMDFFIYCLASAQIMAQGDDPDKSVMITNIISQMSTNMRTLLS